MTKVDEVVARATALEIGIDLLIEMLDDLVHDAKSAEASAINNDGIEAQITYLLSSGMSVEDLADYFEAERL